MLRHSVVSFEHATSSLKPNERHLHWAATLFPNVAMFVFHDMYP
jgi:hypothetical protein